MLSASKEAELHARMEKLDIRNEDLVEKFIRGSGHGGQKINKTSSCVYLKHEPSGIEVKCQRDRSQTMNRYYARCELCEQLETIAHGKKSARQQAQAKLRRQKRRQSRRQRQKTVVNKRKQGITKSLRKSPRMDD